MLFRSVRGRDAAARKVAESLADYGSLGPEQAAARIRKLEQQMLQHARDLEFEEAARLRDQVRALRSQLLA